MTGVIGLWWAPGQSPDGFRSTADRLVLGARLFHPVRLGLSRPLAHMSLKECTMTNDGKTLLIAYLVDAGDIDPDGDVGAQSPISAYVRV